MEEEQLNSEKEEKEITFYQINNGTAESQINNANFQLSHRINKLQVQINSQHSTEKDATRFFPFDIASIDYKDEECSDYIEFNVDKKIKQFKLKRVLLINHHRVNEELALMVVGRMMKSETKFPTTTAYCCSAERENLRMEQIIEDFERQVAEENSKKAQLLVIYGNRNLPGYALEFLKLLTSRGGIADSFITRLNKLRIAVIYITSDKSLFGLSSPNFPVIEISPLHLFLFRKLFKMKEVEELFSLTNNALYNYNWMQKFGLKEKQVRIEELISKKKLKEELESVIEEVDQEEEKTIKELLKRSLHRIVLFAGVWFEGIRIDEFQNLVAVLLGDRKLEEPGSETKSVNIVEQWKENGDDIISEVGLILEIEAGGYHGYKFESRARKDISSKLLSKQYPLFLVNQFEKIENAFVLSPVGLSAKFQENIFRFTVFNASNDPGRYVTDLLFKLSSLIADVGEDELAFGNYLWKLRYFTKSWPDYADYKPSFDRYIGLMMTKPEYRAIIGPLLSSICIPEREDSLEYVRKLLNATGEGEEYVYDKLIPSIINRWLDDLPGLFKTVESWNVDGKELPQAGYCYFYSSVCLTFYEKRFIEFKKSGLDSLVIKHLCKQDPQQSFSYFIELLFTAKSRKIFDSVFGPAIKEQIESEKDMEQLSLDSFYRLYAYMLLRIMYLLDEEIESGTSYISAEEFWYSILDLVEQRLDIRYLRKGLMGAVEVYNKRIAKEMFLGNKQNGRKEFFK